MQRDFEKFLWDIQQAGTDIMALTKGKTQDDYLAEKFVRLAVERSFEIIGEAITQCRQEFPRALDSISDASLIVAFRNKLAHGYHSVDDILVWRIIEFSLPQLLAEVNSLIKTTQS